VIDPAICPPQFVAQTADAVRALWTHRARTAVILGSGLGRVIDGIHIECEFPYERLPRFPRSLAEGHRGVLVCGRVDDEPILLLDGRFHRYEGYHVSELTLPIAVLHALGVEQLIITNACGGLNTRFRSGEIMAIAEHVNLLTVGPRPVLASDEPKAPRWCGTRDCYDAELLARTAAIARTEDFICHRGTYIGVTGPNYETRAEYRFFRKIGGDVVGMSTVPEVLAARYLGMRVLGLSMITNVACPDRPTKTTHEEVKRLAALAIPNVAKIIRGVVKPG
jgi:purine-nucleoside phosphorylase